MELKAEEGESLLLMDSWQADTKYAHLEELCLKLLHVLPVLSVFINQHLALLPAGVCDSSQPCIYARFVHLM